MSVRLTLLAMSALALTACDGNPLRTPVREAACHCPTTAAPAAAAPTRTARAEAPRRQASGARLYRVRGEPVVVREGGSYSYRSSDEGLSGGYGGRYGARGGGYTAGGVSVSVQESESASSRYSYSESSSGYSSASGGGMAYTGGAVSGGYSPSGPQQPYVRYKSASTTPGGWLEWPGKVEN